MNKVKIASPYVLQLKKAHKGESKEYNKALKEVASCMVSESEVTYTGDVVENINKKYKKIANKI